MIIVTDSGDCDDSDRYSVNDNSPGGPWPLRVNRVNSKAKNVVTFSRLLFYIKGLTKYSRLFRDWLNFFLMMVDTTT